MALWFLTIASYTAYKEYYLRAGEEVMLKVAPVDPRDIFRGDYVILNYEISSQNKERLQLADEGKTAYFMQGKTVYVMLEKDGKYYKSGDVYVTRPAEGLFIKGEVDFWGMGSNFTIIYGIENFFVPEDQGKIIESGSNMNRVSAKVVINAYGNASIKELYIDDKKADFKSNYEKDN
jgi:uncharacterized membrane-anchored protein